MLLFARCFRRAPRALVYLTFVLLVNVVLWQWYTDQTAAFTRQFSPFKDKPELPLLASRRVVRNVNRGCAQLLNGTAVNTTHIDTLNRDSITRASRERLQSLVKDCASLKLEHGYFRWPLTFQEKQFPLAFSFKLHTAPEMFERMLSVLWRPQNLYVVHVDRKTPNDVFQLIQDIAACFDNVILTERRFDVIYTSILSLYADIECVRTALKSPVAWRYHLSLSGQEFPLKTNLEIVQILTLMNGINDVENYSPSQLFKDKSLVYKNEIINGSNILTSKKRTAFQHVDVVIRKGSAYNTVCREFLEWVLLDRVSQDLLQWLNDTWAPDELFWATANYMPGAPGGVRTDIRHDTDTHLSRAVVWQWDSYKCKGPYVHFICIYITLDLPWLMKRPELIANKFDSSKDSLVLDCLEESLQLRAEEGYQQMMSPKSLDSLEPRLVSALNWTYYRTLPHLRGKRV